MASESFSELYTWEQNKRYESQEAIGGFVSFERIVRICLGLPRGREKIERIMIKPI